MNRGDLQYREVLLVRKMPEKVHPSQIALPVQLAEQLYRVAGSVFGSAPIAHAVTTDDQHLRPRPLFEHSRQSAHENMKPAIRLEIPRAIGHDLIRPRQAATAAQPETCRRVRLHDGRVDPLVHHRDSVPMNIRVLRSLPFRRALSPIDGIEPH